MTRNELLLKLHSVSSNSDKDFQEIIVTALDSGFVTERDLAHGEGTSLATIRRWKEGKALPHPIMRPYVFRYLIEKLQGAKSK